MRKKLLLPLLVVAAAGAVAVTASTPRSHAAPGPAPAASGAGIHKIRHVVIVMQENRSFDSYFGTYPGADGIPMRNGVPTVCVPDPLTGVCVRPYHDRTDRDGGGPHQHLDAIRDIDGGRMDGFIAQEQRGRSFACDGLQDPRCTIAVAANEPDVMGYHDRHEIPNYWRYADEFVLQDHLFESATSWSLPAHLFLVSGWSAACTRKGDPLSCHSVQENPGAPPGEPQDPSGAVPHYAWTDLTYLLHRHHVRWRYYVVSGGEPDCGIDRQNIVSLSQSGSPPLTT